MHHISYAICHLPVPNEIATPEGHFGADPKQLLLTEIAEVLRAQVRMAELIFHGRNDQEC